MTHLDPARPELPDRIAPLPEDRDLLESLHRMETALRTVLAPVAARELVWVFGVGVRDELHKIHGFPPPVDVQKGTFWGRPFRVDYTVRPAYAALLGPGESPWSP